MAAAGAARRRAPAKLNLYLHVVGRRADGYHLLDSLVAFADLGDVVEARAAAGLSLELAGPFAPALAGAAEPENLVLRAARALAAETNVPAGAALRLVKNLPVAAGLGGGSSDAAAALRLLCGLWGVDPGEGALAAIAASLGADVPVCLAGRPAWLGGIGEAVAPAPPLPPAAVLLVNPLVPLPTPSVFKARQGPFSAPARFADPPPDAAALAALLATRRNDLTEAAIRLAPAIGAVLDRLAALEGVLLARMSGSGATCFALFAGPEAAREAASRLAAERPGWWAAAGRLLG